MSARNVQNNGEDGLILVHAVCSDVLVPELKRQCRARAPAELDVASFADFGSSGVAVVGCRPRGAAAVEQPVQLAEISRECFAVVRSVPVFGGVCAKHDCCRLCRRACDVEDGLLVLRCLRRSARDVM